MPTLQKRSICVVCRRSFDGSGDYCPQHRKPRKPRPSSAGRGYGYRWQKVREEVLLRHGIPREQWSLYDVDHNPPYNKEIEPDHRKYQLTPRLHAEHSRKTAEQDIKRDERGQRWVKG